MRVLARSLALLLSLCLVTQSLRLHLPPGWVYGPDRIGPDVLAQLRFLRAALDAGAGERMQALFPEGFFFSHALYGLAWVEVGMRQPPAERTAALREASWALARLESPSGQAIFDPALDPPFGVFYTGWANRLRGGLLLIQPAAERDTQQQARFAAACAALAAAFDRSATPFLMAYPGQSWPVDSTVAIATLRLHDRLLPARYERTVARWLTAAQARLDPTSGLLPHRTNPRDGSAASGARGTSQSIIQRMLPEIDPHWAQVQYRLFREQFIDTPPVLLGLPGVREYPRGSVGYGDVDSGPLVAGLSASATVVTAGAAQAHGDQTLATSLFHAAEFVGLPLEWGGTKRYGFGLLPVGDAFLVWSKTARVWGDPAPPPPLPPALPWWWQLPLDATLGVLLALLWLPVWLPWLRRRAGRAGRAPATNS